MSTFDPTRIMTMARVLNSGTSDEKLDLIAAIDPATPVDSGILMRALQDDDAGVRLAALRRLSAADVRPMDMVLDALLDDDDERIRELARDLQGRPNATNPLEQLIPQIEQMADSLGPLGGLLRSMIETLRGIGEGDEREQLVSVAKADAANPASLVVVQQALRSLFISVRLAGLRKVLEMEAARVPESLISQFATDPSPDVREAAEAVIRAGKVGDIDEDAVRSSIMGSMMQSLGGGLPGLDLGSIGQMLGGGGPGGLDIGALLGGGGSGGLDLGSLFGALGGDDGETDEGPSAGSASRDEPVAHLVDGFVYAVGDGRVLERLARSLGRLDDEGDEPGAVRLQHDGLPERWAIEPVAHQPSQSPGWIETLAGCGLEVDDDIEAEAEQARFVSQQIWGAAYADHAADTALTLVFHDGILTRAAWSGAATGAYAGDRGPLDGSEEGPLALLNAFLADPTDDKLAELPEPRPLFEA